jgi:ABC-type glycerol-3-phosphate transport system substrate-binding protein
LQEVSREGKEILTLGVYGPLGLSTQDALLAFNRSSEDYYLELQPYASVDALNLAIASGEGPDLLNVSGFPVAAYARKNLFYDLSSVIGDPAQYYENVLELTKIGGVQVSVLTGFSLDALAVQSQYAEEAAELTWEDYKDLMEATGLYGQRYWEFILPSFLTSSLDSFVDHEHKTAYFTSELFYDFLATLLNFTADDTAEVGTEAVDVLLNGTYMFSSDNSLSQYHYIGFPSPSGSNLTVNGLDHLNLAILQQSDHIEGAEAVVQFFLSSDWQESQTFTLPLRKDALSAAVELTNSVAGVTDSVPEGSLSRLERLIAAADNSAEYDAELYQIAADELPALFRGEKTIEETAEIIQSRAMIYLSEQYD